MSNIGDLIYLDPRDGTVSEFVPYTRKERFVRWLGRVLRNGLASYHKREPLGYILDIDNENAVCTFLAKRP